MSVQAKRRGDPAVSAALGLRQRFYKKHIRFDNGKDNRIKCSYRNNESVADLFKSLMVLMDGLFSGWNTKKKHKGMPLTSMTRNLRVSTYYGCLYFGESPGEIFTDDALKKKHPNSPGVIFVEDPFDKKENTARALSRRCCKAISKATKATLESYKDISISEIFQEYLDEKERMQDDLYHDLLEWANQDPFNIQMRREEGQYNA